MKSKLQWISFFLILVMFFPVSVFANENNYVGCDLIGVEESKFENLIEEIQNIETTVLYR